ncbi:efflux RND transporter permease subunit [candidate division KSB1 bacterium]|nr:efflux RND transporter permease subunit [candidate division KSB1 bacterium]
MPRQSSLAKLSVHRPVTVMMLFLATLVVGFVAYLDVPVELFPRGFVFPALGVWIPYNNANPSEIEEQIARPVEEIIQTISGVRRIQSSSRDNGAWFWIEFSNNSDMDVAYADIRDRMDRVKPELPTDIERIYPRKFSDDDESIAVYAIAIDRELEDAYSLMDTHIRKVFSRVDGVANVELWGVDRKAVQIRVDQAKVDAYHVDLYQLVQELQRDNFVLASGHVTDGGKKFYVRSLGKYSTVDEIQNLRIKNTNLRLKDIADVTFDVADERQWVQRIDRKKAVWVEIYKESQANTVDVCKKIDAILQEKILPNPQLAGMKFEKIFDQGTYVIESIDNLWTSGMWGGIFSFFILFYFLRRVRMTLIINLAIPISLLATVIVIYFIGWTMNIMTLMGMMICVGMVVDNSIVVVENIYRLRKEGLSPKDAAFQGASEVAMPITLATMTTVVVFLPLMLMGDNPGMKFYMLRMGVPVIAALVASLIVALVFIPLATLMLTAMQEPKEPKSITRMIAFYERLLHRTLAHRVDAATIFVFLVISGFAIMKAVPQTDETRGNINDLWFAFELPSNYTIEDADRYFKSMEDFLYTNKEKYGLRMVDVRFRSNWGRMNAFLYPPPSYDWWQVIGLGVGRAVGLVDKGPMTREEVLADIKENAPKRPGVEMRTSWRQAGANEQGTVTVSLYGDDTSRLTELAGEVERRLRTIPDFLDVNTDLEEGVDEIRLRVDREQAAKYGVNAQTVAGTIGYALRGVELPDYRTEDREVDIRVQMRKEDRETLHQLMNLRLRQQNGQEVPLAHIASVSVQRGYGRIERENGKTTLAVKATTTSENLEALYHKVDQVMGGFQMPRGYAWSKGQRFSRMQETQESSNAGLWLAATFVLLLMGVLFESVILPLSVIVCVPFAFVGVGWTLFITRTPIDLMAMIGLFILIGVVVNNAIVLVDLINQLRLQGYSRYDAIIEAGRHRFRPIMMTALTTIAGLLPMALGTAKVIGISYAAMGRTTMGGMISATALTLLVVPLAYTYFDDLREWWKQVLALMMGKKKA